MGPRKARTQGTKSSGQRPRESHLEFPEHSHRFVILRSAATKDPQLLFGPFPAQWRRFVLVASPSFIAKQEKQLQILHYVQDDSVSDGEAGVCEVASRVRNRAIQLIKSFSAAASMRVRIPCIFSNSGCPRSDSRRGSASIWKNQGHRASAPLRSSVKAFSVSPSAA